ncbi:chemotaxis protein CheW [Chungangia koreensis]|uniref:Chemotaxis protein CheW n=1 Tax=Chungangia koreensis TaxID=752657 RepID=A0ABV8X218_9LACT
MENEERVLELIEYIVGGNRFGLPIEMVNEIIQPMSVTKIPQSHPYVEGIIQLRGEVYPVIDFRSLLGGGNDELLQKFIVASVEGRNVVFHVDDVLQIHRISLSVIEEPTDLYEGDHLPLTGVVKFEEGMMLLMDYVKLLNHVLER